VTWRTRFQQPLGRNHIFRRALGAVPGERLRVTDATAGFAQDSMLALSLGCEVTAIERSPVIALLIEEAVARARRDDEWLRERLAGLRLVTADALTYLPEHEPPDVVYIDPMFSKPKSSAKSPKEMQLLQELLGDQPSGETELLEAARRVARRRVVVKRPLKARASLAPSHSYKGQSVRYDVYLV
jgi:16S rRNA (guanine1516-N2)-methyltransferase